MPIKDPEARKIYDKQYHADHPHDKKKSREATQRYRDRNPDNWIKRYGLTRPQYDQLLLQQNGTCRICHGPPTGKYRVYQVDHDHVTGAVRGLLCHMCNMALAYLRDKPEIAQAVVDYLEAPQDLRYVCYPYLRDT